MKKITSNKLLSILTITIIYIITTIISIFIYNKLPYSIYLNIFIVDVIATIIIFIFSHIFKNSSIYDPYWSATPIVIITPLFFERDITISSILILIAIWYWGVRLTTNWAIFFTNLNKQDWRYTKYEKSTKKLYPLVNIFGIHLMPTILVYIALLPAIVGLGIDKINIFTIIGFIICILAATLELVADIEMYNFKKNNKGLIRVGLWKYSRHPNYLGEILMWWGIAIMGISLTNNYYLLIGAILITLLFLTISIPMQDKRQSKKEGYKKYREETRNLLPIKRRNI